jgi:hypothetical protein
LPEAISELYVLSAACGSIFGIEGTPLGSISRPNFNPKYWATGHAVVDIASGKNALAAIQAENFLQIIAIKPILPTTCAILRMRNLLRRTKATRHGVWVS